MSCEINFTPVDRRFLKGLRVKPAVIHRERLSWLWKGRDVK